MFISVLLPAPFSPSRAWMVPGATERPMWSLATRLPKRFVMPCSSRFTRLPASSLRSCSDMSTRPGTWVPGRETLRSGLTYETGAFVGVGISPLMIPALSAITSAFRAAGILLAKSWYGASVTPPLARVPM